MPEISVVIPTYRRPQLLRHCLAALARQRFPPKGYEVIVVSDGPDALTKNLVMELAGQYAFLCYEEMPQKKGPAAARNWGWKKARGRLVAFTDDDTQPDAGWLAAFWWHYQGEPLIAYTGKIKVPLSANPTDYEKNTAGLEQARFVTANCCCTKAALEKTGGFDERFSMAWREDSDLEFQLLRHQVPIVPVPDALVVHPVRKACWGISLKEQKKGMFNALLYKKYPQWYRQKIQSAPPWNYYLTVGSFFLLLLGLVAKAPGLALASLACWLFLLADFIAKRLRHTSKAASHIAEMIVTSLLIPFVSVYWQLYGAWRYKVFFL